MIYKLWNIKHDILSKWIFLEVTCYVEGTQRDSDLCMDMQLNEEIFSMQKWSYFGCRMGKADEAQILTFVEMS